MPYSWGTKALSCCCSSSCGDSASGDRSRQNVCVPLSSFPEERKEAHRLILCLWFTKTHRDDEFRATAALNFSCYARVPQVVYFLARRHVCLLCAIGHFAQAVS